jgi:hypothetical protein
MLDELPQRPSLTPESARDTPVRTVLERIDRLAERTGIKVTPWYCTGSGKWEVSAPDGMSFWDNGRRMIDALEEYYGTPE